MNEREIMGHRDRCVECGAPIAVEMDGLWSYRVCTRNGHVQPRGAGDGPLGHAVMLFATRGQ
jgi:hypothetical protein